MATLIANPIYESVFKYMIAKLSLTKDNVKNRVEELLQDLNQSNRTQDAHILCIDEEMYSNDDDMQEVIRTPQRSRKRCEHPTHHDA